MKFCMKVDCKHSDIMCEMLFLSKTLQYLSTKLFPKNSTNSTNSSSGNNL